MYIFLAIVIAALIAFCAYIYIKTARIMKKLDIMIDNAIDGSFAQTDFSEAHLSRIEAKLCRYLTSGETSKKQLAAEKANISGLVSDISHQTKTPITNIMLYSQLLSENTDISEEARGIIKQIELQTEKLGFLISSLVKISRLESGIIAPSPAENRVSELLKALDYSAAAQKKGIELIIESSCEISAVFDLKWTGEALGNIVDNAIKYTPAGGMVKVSAREYEFFARIDVEDTGIGVSEEDSAKIFSRFYRAPAVSGESGVGLGLYLAREILSRQGGYIKAFPRAGGGTVFSVFLSKGENLSKL